MEKIKRMTMTFTLSFSVEFGKDIDTLDKGVKTRLAKRLEKIKEQPELSKPLRHLHNVFSERLENYRIIFQVKNETNEVNLLRFVKRSDKNLKQYGYK